MQFKGHFRMSMASRSYTNDEIKERKSNFKNDSGMASRKKSKRSFFEKRKKEHRTRGAKGKVK